MLPFAGILLKDVVENYISHAIAISGFDPNTPKNQKKIESTYIESPNVADQKPSSELLNSTSGTKAVLAEALHSLDLFENYLKSPSEETAKPLKLLFDSGKSVQNEIFTPDKIDNFLDISRSFLINKCSQDDKKIKKSPDCQQGSSNSGNGELGNVDLESTLINISEKASKFHLVNEKSSPFSPNFERKRRNFEVGQPSNPKNLRNAPEEFANNLVNKIPTTKEKDFVRSGEDSPIGPLRNKNARNDKPEREISRDSRRIDSVFPQVKSGKKGEGIHGSLNYSRTENILEENELKSKNFIQFPNPALKISLRMKDLEDENLFLKRQIKSLQDKYEAILAELGQIAVLKTAKENKERKSELFQEIFRSPSSKPAVLPASKDTTVDDMNGSLNRFPISQATNNNVDTPLVIYPATSSEQQVEGSEAIVERSNHQPGKDEVVANDKNRSEIERGNRKSSKVSTFRKRNENQTLSKQNSSKEKTSGGKGVNQPEKVQETNDLASTSRESYDDLPFSVQQDDSGTEYISLGKVPSTSVATTLYNNYKLLLLSLAQGLLSCDVVSLKGWASQNFSINDPQNATDIFFQFDKKGVINASDLSQLSHFFESIVRIDLVYIIDAFLLGDYSLLRQNTAPKQQAANAAQTSQNRSITMYQSMFNAMNIGRQSLVNPAASGTLQTNPRRNPATLKKPGNDNGAQRPLPQQTQLAASRNSSDTASPTHFHRSPNENESTVSEQQNFKPATTGFTPTRMANVVVADGSNVKNERRTMAGNSLTRRNPSATSNPRNAQAIGSNGSKHSKFQRPETERSNISNSQSPSSSRNRHLDRDDNWLCSHYKRHCYVKFECCNNFWPCHRCHNNQSSCGRKKLKSRDTKMLKCVYCNKVQQFGHSCCDCGLKFSDYYCGLCKHLTGKDDHPYHCEKCGICRIHGDRSFHCDVCGVCLDVQLRGNHKCREGSAHDECCICLEDAFTGCQILPCSHKVHKECATQMIRSGITRCPICRESFAHKLERRPMPNSRKRSGK